MKGVGSPEIVDPFMNSTMNYDGRYLQRGYCRAQQIWYFAFCAFFKRSFPCRATDEGPPLSTATFFLLTSANVSCTQQALMDLVFLHLRAQLLEPSVRYSDGTIDQPLAKPTDFLLAIT